MNSRKDVVEKVLAYIEDHLEQEITLEKIAEFAGYSRFHLNRMFTEETGDTIHRYVKDRRLTAAAEKLARTEISIAQIAMEAGYHSQQAFSLAFKQKYSCPPRAYRLSGTIVSGQSRISMRREGCQKMGSGHIMEFGRMAA